MKKLNRLLSLKDECGVTAIIIALSITMLISLAALAVDIGYLMVGKNELQNTADAAALYATGQLGEIYKDMAIEELPNYVADQATFSAFADEIAAKNRAGGKYININSNDVVIGNWDADNKILTPNMTSPNAIQVTARRDDNANAPLSTFFARVFGRDEVNVTADATAALTGPSIMNEGGLPFPVGISKARFDEAYCDEPIRLYPTGTIEGCAGWHTYDIWPANAPTLWNILEGLNPDLGGGYESPMVITPGDELVFIGGNVTSSFDYLEALFNVMRLVNEEPWDGDKNPDTWTTAVVVYDWDDCSNPTGLIEILTFATITIYEVLVTPEKQINATIVCNGVIDGRGGGANNFGTLGSIPSLVE
jgi:Flp pilus assembly protein TadG